PVERAWKCTNCWRSRDSVFLSSRRRHTRSKRDWSSDVCSSDLSSPTWCLRSVVGARSPEGAVDEVGGRAGGRSTSGGPPGEVHQGWGPLRPYWRGPVEDRRRGAVSAESARPRRRPRACRTAVTRTSSSCSSWLVLTWRGPPRYGRRPGPACSPRGGPTGGQAVRVWPGERGRRESCRRLHEDGRATREGDPAVGKLRRGRAAITCGAVRTRRERSVEVQEGLQYLRGVLVDLVGAVLAGTDLVLQAGHGVLTDHAVLLGVGPGR